MITVNENKKLNAFQKKQLLNNIIFDSVKEKGISIKKACSDANVDYMSYLECSNGKIGDCSHYTVQEYLRLLLHLEPDYLPDVCKLLGISLAYIPKTKLVKDLIYS